MSILENTREALQALFPEQVQEKEQQVPETTEEAPGKEGIPEQKPGVVATDFKIHGSHLDVVCEPEQIVEVAKILDEKTFFLESISGADWLKEELLEIIYDFTCFQPEAYRITVRTKVPRNQPSLPTISTLIPGADWHERETYDFYGINFEGHPNLIRILLPEDADFHPLLKDYMP